MESSPAMQLRRGMRFFHRARWYRVRRSGARTLQLLRDCRELAASGQTDISTWLELRPRIREALYLPDPVMLCYVTENDDDPIVLRTAILLLARINNSYAAASLTRLVHHSDFRVRRAACRALHRLSAWKLLRRIATEHPDSRIRALAQQAKSKPWSNRLNTFLDRSNAVPHEQTSQPLFVASEVKIGQGRPPRQGREIRRFLVRIRRWVRRQRDRKSCLWSDCCGRLLGS